MNRFKTILVPSLAVAALFCAGTLAHAGNLPISITFDSANQNAYAGTTVSFTGFLTDIDTADPVVNLDFDTYNVDAPLLLDDTPFLTYAPYFMTPNTTSDDFELFAITIPSGATSGLYTGSFEIQGDTGGDQFVVGNGFFDVNVIPTPEPGSLILLGTGLIAVAGMARRRFGR